MMMKLNYKKYLEKRLEIVKNIYRQALAYKLYGMWKYKTSTPHITRTTYDRINKKTKNYFLRGCYVYDFNFFNQKYEPHYECGL